MRVTTYTVIIRDHILDREVMRIETDSEALALVEAERYSLRYGAASVYENPYEREVAHFRSGARQDRRNSSED